MTQILELSGRKLKIIYVKAIMEKIDNMQDKTGNFGREMETL